MTFKYPTLSETYDITHWLANVPYFVDAFHVYVRMEGIPVSLKYVDGELKGVNGHGGTIPSRKVIIAEELFSGYIHGIVVDHDIYAQTPYMLDGRKEFASDYRAMTHLAEAGFKTPICRKVSNYKQILQFLAEVKSDIVVSIDETTIQDMYRIKKIPEWATILKYEKLS